MNRGSGGVWRLLVAGGAFGAALGAIGAASVAPFPAIRGWLPVVWHDRVALAGAAVLVAVALATTMVVSLKATVFLLSLVVSGRDALDRLPDVDPLVGGAVWMVVVGAVIVGGGAAMTGDLGDEGRLPYVDGAFDGDPRGAHGIVGDDELQGFGTTGERLPEYRDADGDRLPDSWERAGETPDGVPLPGADPNHKDLYVQLNYANGHPPLNRSERRELRRIWANMAVSNPDGEPGIDIHVVDEPPLGGAVDDRVTVGEDGFSKAFIEQYYSADYLGDRRCSHYLSIFGDVDGIYAGWGLSPGYLSVVDGGEHGRTAGVGDRVRILTHELLHNVAGDLGNGDTHVRRGWLAGVDGEFEPRLSGTTSRDLNRTGFERSAAFETQLCEQPVGSSTDADG
jgi:hypothetical protein